MSGNRRSGFSIGWLLKNLLIVKELSKCHENSVDRLRNGQLQCCFYFLCQSTLKFDLHVIITTIPVLTVIFDLSMFQGHSTNAKVKCQMHMVVREWGLFVRDDEVSDLLELIYMYANPVQSYFAKRYCFTFCGIFAFATSPLPTTV